ncbi:MAG: phosphatidate cytidylyltransferase [Treponema sp.]|jgi:phosphatidate cytidylyltransferase|nr:phosphatidate cytidylyltransferase [Treponema sp.]
MNKIIQRLIIFVVGIPLITLIVLGLPHYHHLALNILVIIFSALGAIELSDLLRKKDMAIPRWEAALLGILGPASVTAVVSFNINSEAIQAFFIAGASWLLVSRIFSKNEGLKTGITRAAAGFAVMVYPGVFLEWIIKMARWEVEGSSSAAQIFILFFLLIVFANDSAAWAAGMLFGKGNRGIIPASPNKSIAGFVGGVCASIIVAVTGALLFPEVFVPHYLGAIPSGIIVGLLSGIAATLGDLGESVMKRSADTKDSGSLIPGRGGVLDSIDSIALAAPVFYCACLIFFI